jgi:hypothetical protein
MFTPCTVCAHSQRPEIEVALLGGMSPGRVAALFRVSRFAVGRHRAAHLLPAGGRRSASTSLPGEEADPAAVPTAAQLVSQARDLQERTLASLRQAQADGDLRAVFTGIRAARGNLELLARLLGRLESRPEDVDLHTHPEWLAIRSALVAALQPFPDARRAVAESLLLLDAPSALPTPPAPSPPEPAASDLGDEQSPLSNLASTPEHLNT